MDKSVRVCVRSDNFFKEIYANQIIYFTRIWYTWNLFDSNSIYHTSEKSMIFFFVNQCSAYVRLIGIWQNCSFGVQTASMLSRFPNLVLMLVESTPVRSLRNYRVASYVRKFNNFIKILVDWIIMIKYVKILIWIEWVHNDFTRYFFFLSLYTYLVRCF